MRHENGLGHIQSFTNESLNVYECCLLEQHKVRSPSGNIRLRGPETSSGSITTRRFKVVSCRKLFHLREDFILSHPDIQQKADSSNIIVNHS